MAAKTSRWLGNAVDITQVSTITIGGGPGGFATNDTPTITVNGKDLVITIGTTATDAFVTEEISRAINDTSKDGDLVEDETRNVGGQEIPEFTEFEATYSGLVITLTAITAGKPFVVSAVPNAAGAGTLTVATPTAATGKHFWDNADNWTDVVPVLGNEWTVVFDDTDVSCLYNLTTTLQPTKLLINKGFTGRIGLPKINNDNQANEYTEYRGTYLTFVNEVGNTTCETIIGQGTGEGSSLIKLDFGAVDTNAALYTIDIYGTATRYNREWPAVMINNVPGGEIPVTNVVDGDVGFAVVEGETFTSNTIGIGAPNSRNCKVWFGSGVVFTASTITQISGTAVSYSASKILALNMREDGVFTIRGGDGTDAAAAITIDSGTVHYLSTDNLSGTIRIGKGGVLDFRGDNRTRTIAVCNIHRGGTIHDPLKTVTWTAPGILVARTKIKNVTLDIGTHYTITPS